MGENGLSASDVALMSRDGEGYNGWGGMIWLFAILAMMGGYSKSTSTDSRYYGSCDRRDRSSSCYY